MFSWGSLFIRRSTHLLHQRRGVIARAFSTFNYGDHNKTNGGGGDTFMNFSRLVSSGVGVASATSFGYWLFDANDNHKPSVCFADSGKESFSTDDFQLPRSISPNNTGKFLFGGTFRSGIKLQPNKIKSTQYLEFGFWINLVLKIIFRFHLHYGFPFSFISL